MYNSIHTVPCFRRPAVYILPVLSIVYTVHDLVVQLVACICNQYREMASYSPVGMSSSMISALQ